MSADVAAVILILAAAPPATLFPIVYGFTAPWWKTLIGRALLTKAIGLALLIDISLIYKFLGDEYFLRDVVRLSVYALITVGTWMQFSALLVEKYHARKERRTHRA